MEQGFVNVAVGFAVVLLIAMVIGKIKGIAPTEILFGRLNVKLFSGIKDSFSRKPLYERNGTTRDLQDLIARLFRLSKKNGWFAICPAHIRYKDMQGSLPMILVTSSGIIGINAFGFGGVIYPSNKETWNQRLNGSINKIPNLTVLSQKEENVLKTLLKDMDLSDWPVSIKTVLTSPSVHAASALPSDVFIKEVFFDNLSKSQGVEGIIDPTRDGPILAASIKKYSYR